MKSVRFTIFGLSNSYYKAGKLKLFRKICFISCNKTLITPIIHENKNFLEFNLHKNKILDQPCGDVFMEPLKNYTDHFDSKKRIRKIHSEKEFE